MTTIAERRNATPTATRHAGPTPRTSQPTPRGEPLGDSERLLRQRDALPSGHPDRVTLRTRVIEKNLPLANSLARRYAGRGEPIEDLRQVAALALVKAVDGYESDRQIPFIGYAVPTILGAIKRHFRDTTWGLRVPRWVQELDQEATVTADELSQRWGRRPTNVELADHLCVSLDDLTITLAARQAYHLVSLNTPAGDSDTFDYPELVNQLGGLDPGFADVEDRLALLPVLAALPQRERRILVLRYYYRMTQARIALEVGLSQMHVSRLLRQSFAKLRSSLSALSPSPAENSGSAAHGAGTRPVTSIPSPAGTPSPAS
jgi:RNA polymerase sigma-B factor